MEGKLKISVIVGIAFVAGIIGTLSYGTFQNSSENTSYQSNSNEQNLNIGAYVIVEAYREDGTLYQKFEGHNDLTDRGINGLVGCLTGEDITPWGIQCTGISNGTALRAQNQTTLSSIGILSSGNHDLTLKPDGCDTDSVNNVNGCTGWEIIETHDFADLTCTPNVNCYNVTAAFSAESGTNIGFNEIQINPEIPVGPDDRLKINMTFNIPP